LVDCVPVSGLVARQVKKKCWVYKSFWFGMTLGFTADSRKSRIQNSKIGFCKYLYKSQLKHHVYKKSLDVGGGGGVGWGGAPGMSGRISGEEKRKKKRSRFLIVLS
jgi:hypothetical protein